jgi:prevent-host-death family protein
MRNLTATEASRRFAEVLDAVEHKHQSFIVTRGGRAIAAIGPAATGGGRALKEVLRRHRADRTWPDDLKALRNDLVAEERNWHA